MKIDAIFEKLPETANARADLVHRGRHCDVEFLIEVGERAFQIAVQAGRVTGVHPGPLRMRDWSFAIRAGESAWREFWAPIPGPGFNDLFAMTSHGHATIEGNVGALLSNLRYIKELVQLPRTMQEGDAGAGAMTAAHIEPIVGRYIHLDIEGTGYRVYFEEAGAGVPLVCLHTAGAHSSQYRHLMCDPRVTERFRVIAFDMPWHGKSSPPVGWEHTEYRLTSAFYVGAVTAFLDALALDRPVVMGCSMGGRVVLRVAFERADRLRAVIGLEGSDHPAPWYDSSWLERTEFLRGDFCTALVSGLIAPQSPDEYRWETLWHYHQSGSGVFRGDMHFYRTDSEYRDTGSGIDTAHCPVYLLTGEYDYSCTPALTRETAARIPGAEAIVMDGLGHFPMSENPDRFAAFLLPVLDRILMA